MPNLNRVQIIGRLGKDPESRTTKNGSAFTVFSVASDHRWKTRDGEVRKETNWFQVEAWGRLGTICMDYLKKGRLVYLEGRLVYLEGRLSTTSYEHEGQTRYFTKVVASQVQMLDRPDQEPADADVPVEEVEE